MAWYDPLKKYAPKMPRRLRIFFAAFMVVFLGYVLWQVVT